MKKSTMALVCAVGLLLALLFIHPGSSPAHVESSHFSVYQPTVFSFHLRVYAVVGKPTISAAFINRVLEWNLFDGLGFSRRASRRRHPDRARTEALG